MRYLKLALRVICAVAALAVFFYFIAPALGMPLTIAIGVLVFLAINENRIQDMEARIEGLEIKSADD